MLVVVAVMALIAGLRAGQGEGPVLAVAQRAPDPELARCRGTGEAALADAACQRAWRRARERFFARSSS